MFTKTKFGYYDAIELTTKAISLTVVTEQGPRIASLRQQQGENIFYWDNTVEKNCQEWRLMGGHRVWIARPGADESRETYLPDNKPSEIQIQGDLARIIAPVDPVLETRRGITIKALSDNTIQVDNFIENSGKCLYSAAIWALTCTAPSQGTQYGLPLGDDSSWNNCTMVLFKEWDGHGNSRGFGDIQFAIKEDMLLVTPEGLENKRMLQCHKGVMAMSDPIRQLTFIKKFDYNPNAKYPLGCNAAIYIGPNNFMVEMETMGEETTLKPGQIVNHREIWTLLPSAIRLDSSCKLLEAIR